MQRVDRRQRVGQTPPVTNHKEAGSVLVKEQEG